MQVLNFELSHCATPELLKPTKLKDERYEPPYIM